MNTKNDKSKKFFLLLIVLVSNQIFSQHQTTGSNNIWLHYVGKNWLTKKCSFTLETTMRYADGFNEKQQYFIRPSVDFQFNKNIGVSIGYSHYNTYVYGDKPLNKISTPEDHVWFQGTYTTVSGNFKFINRLRDEIRFVGIAEKNIYNNLEIGHYEHRNRLRYMFLVNYNLTKDLNQKTKLFLLAGNEAFINIAVNNAKTLFQQNRIIGGMGYNINSNHQIQLSYIHQNIWDLSNTIMEENPTLRLSYITNFDWYKKKEI